MNKFRLKLLAGLFCTILFSTALTAGDVNLSIAASLKDVMAQLTQDYSAKNSGVKFLNNTGASGALAKQIANGAPADIFFSANIEWMDFLKEKKLVDEKNIAILAYNVLVFAGRPDLSAVKLQDITALNRIAIGSPKSVPAGEYAMQAFKNAGIEKQLAGKLVMAKDVRACLLYADRGEVDGAFVYKTDALWMAKNVKILFVVPQDLYSRVTYPMALIGNKNPDAASFYEFLKSDNARAVLVEYGFAVK